MAKASGNILIIDDDEYIQLSAKLLLDQYFTKVSTLSDPIQSEDFLSNQTYDVIILDMNFKQGETSGAAGLNWLKKIHANHPRTSILLMTAYGDLNLAVEAMKEGAVDFILKPWHNEKLVSTVQLAFNLSQQNQKVDQLKVRQQIMASDMDKEIIGESKEIKAIMSTVKKIAPSDADVLILGENGTGKEVIARAIHKHSLRSKEAFIKVDLGSISETLFESELFGHVKGAFTDAKEDRTGRFQAASGGTIFLDEIGNLPLSLQAKLLTVLQSREVTKLGTNESKPIDVRIICATNSNLSQMVKDQRFREDLFFRINTLDITIPSLRDRKDDIPLLADHFIKLYGQKYNKQVRRLSTDINKKITAYHWPGNVRELQHAMERAVIMSDTNDLSTNDFSFLTSGNQESKDFDDYDLEKIEAWAIEKAIKKHNGNISRAAKELGLSRGAMYRRMEKYGL